MDANARKTIEGWISKARYHQETARDHLSSYHYSEAVEASQECVELSVKAVLSLLQIRFDYTHAWRGKKLESIAQQIKERRLLARLREHNLAHIRLPRLLFLADFWAQFYLTAKYGLEAGYLASAQDLYDKDQADLAVKHARECLNVARWVTDLSGEKLATLNQDART